MGKPCILLVGAWKHDDKGGWEFVLEEGRMSRLVYIEENWSHEELCTIAAMEFGEDSFRKTSLSYWIPRCGSSSAGKQTPPVQLGSDAGVKTFVRVLGDNDNVNLFVTFVGCEEAEGYCTPIAGEKKSKCWIDGESSGLGCGVQVNADACVGSINRKGDMYTTPPAYNLPNAYICVEDNDFMEQIEAVEEEMMSVKKKKREVVDEDILSVKKKRRERSSFNLFELAGVEEDDVHLSDLDEGEVRPKGYDTDFWEPLLDDQYGGSNAVEIMCSTNSVFDHKVRIGGKEPMFEYPKVEGEFPMIPNTMSTRGGRLTVDGNVDEMIIRDLTEVPDEEFDIPPLFDDMTYEMADIPDLEIDDQDEDIYVGKTFGSKSDCQIALAIYAIKNMFHFKQTRTKKNYFVLTCSDSNCEWRVNAHEMKDSSYYQIRKANLIHSCGIETRSKFGKLATSRVIAAMYKARLNNMGSGQRPLDVQQLLLEELRIPASYFKCWKAQETAHEELRGNEEESYLKLEEYLHMLKLANPGTVAEVETEDDGVGGRRFLYMFLAFSASIQGFRWLRTVLVIDGTYLVGKYKGVLLTASGQDGNFQVFPLAFAVVDSENDDSWKWFLAKLQLIIADSPKLTIISDRNNSIYKALKDVFPQAHHGACVVHLARNVVARFKSKGLSKLVVKAACAYRVHVFNETFGQIVKQNEECAKYLKNIGFGHWARCVFPGDRYNLMTSNVAETLNNALGKGRKSPITELIMFIQSMLTRWFSARRKKALAYGGFVTPEVDKVLSANLSITKGSRVVSIAPWRYEVLGLFGQKHNVDLDRKQCSCKVYDLTKIPCGHAMMAADAEGLPYGQATGDWYRTSLWVKAYAGIIQAHEDPRDGDIPDEIRNRVVLPPKTRRPSGRPQQKRIRSVGEIGDGPSKKTTNNRCGRCGGFGHNRVRCTNPI